LQDADEIDRLDDMPILCLLDFNQLPFVAFRAGLGVK
jgi:hypothetical protein